MTRRTVIAIALSLAVLAAAGCSNTGSPAGVTSDTRKVVVEMLVQDVLPEVGASFAAGQEVRAKDTGTVVGTIAAIERVPAVKPVPTAEGELNAADSPVAEDVRLTIEGECVVSDAGYSFGGTYLYVNNEIKYLTPYTLFNGVIISIEVVEP